MSAMTLFRRPVKLLTAIFLDDSCQTRPLTC
ncbi:hypothetical protein H206_05154 [Candidatus Electrothrix aarhusensis]|uniref:Uncharacterized protein n=1 Tax=Candidatus Electrothrix aarhusensis TaxID=1859131 RepID=A0A3S3UEC3_9BACT|nr:hypothetical protein H206_05154 [Candidatus Electrothrix aarhusensis]